MRPPFITCFIFFPNSSITSSLVTGLILVDLFALGAASGKFNFFNSNLVIGCLGNLTARLFELFVTYFDIEFFFF